MLYGVFAPQGPPSVTCVYNSTTTDPLMKLLPLQPFWPLLISEHLQAVARIMFSFVSSYWVAAGSNSPLTI